MLEERKGQEQTPVLIPVHIPYVPYIPYIPYVPYIPVQDTAMGQ